MTRILYPCLLLFALNSAAAEDPARQCKESPSPEDESLCLGKAFLATGKTAEALKALQNAEAMASDPFQKVVAVLFLARALSAADKPDEAMAQYQRALKLAAEVKNKQAQMMSLNEIGTLYLARKETQQALEHFLAAYPFAANDNERSECHQNIASAYHALRDFDHAIEYQLKSVLMEERSGEGSGYLNARLNLSAYFSDARDYTRAQKEVDEVLAIARNASSPYWEARTLLYLGRMEKSRGNPEKGLEHLRTAAALADKLGMKELRAEIDAEIKLSQ